MIDLVLFLSSATVYSLVHLANGWAFSFLEVSPHISLLYLPAFLRLANVLVLGPVKGTLATALGSLLVMPLDGTAAPAELLAVIASASGPLLAVMIFEYFWARPVHLGSLRDLTIFTLIYALANAVSHHLLWALHEPAKVLTLSNVLWMFVGDFNGALLGAYLLKWVSSRSRLYSTFSSK